MTIHVLALQEYRRRKAAFDDAVNVRAYPRGRAERLLACWLSVALASGVAPSDCGEIVAHWQAERGLTDSWARTILLWQGPDEAEWHAEFRRACAAARAKMEARPGNADALHHHLTLDCIAHHLGLAAPAPQPTEQRLAA